MAQRAYRGREPSTPMDAASLLRVVQRLEEHNIDVWLDGGWGVDALLERQMREHDDLDLVAELSHADRIIELLQEVQVLVHAGYELTEKDYRELHLLRERFGVELPDDVLEHVLAVGSA
jgi:Aminoglycoside-2''-adenylyltransferase